MALGSPFFDIWQNVKLMRFTLLFNRLNVYKKTSIFTSLIGMDGIEWDGMVIIGAWSSKSTFGKTNRNW